MLRWMSTISMCVVTLVAVVGCQQRNVAIVRRSDVAHYGFMDKTGRVVIPANYDRVGSFYGGLASVSLGGKWVRVHNR